MYTELYNYFLLQYKLYVKIARIGICVYHARARPPHTRFLHISSNENLVLKQSQYHDSESSRLRILPTH